MPWKSASVHTSGLFVLESQVSTTPHVPLPSIYYLLGGGDKVVTRGLRRA